MTADTRYRQAWYGCENDRPHIEVNQVWIGKDTDGSILRRIRIIAEYPDRDKKGGRLWITEDLPSKIRPRPYGLNVCPEFNLRYVFELERS